MQHHITKTISNSSYWTVNKHLNKKLGLHATLLLQHFIDLQTKVFGGKQFYQSHNQIEKELSFTYHYIRESVSTLFDNNLITIEKKGMPAKNHYFVLLDKVEELLSLDLDNSQVKLAEPLTSEISSSSEANIATLDKQISQHKTSDIHLTKKSYKANKSINKKIIKKNTIASQSEKNILQRYLDDCIQFDDNMKFKRAYNEIIDYGGFKKVFKVLDFTDSQITNWSRKIDTVYQFSNV